MRTKRKPSITQETIMQYRDTCLAMEASGNHGGGGCGPSDVDMRRGIMFWGTGRGWQLKRDWRDQWAIKFPDVELPPKPEVAKPPRPLSHKALEELLKEYCATTGSDFTDLQYWDQRASRPLRPGWRVWSQSAYRNFFLGSNTHEAAGWLQRAIDHHKAGSPPALSLEA